MRLDAINMFQEKAKEGEPDYFDRYALFILKILFRYRLKIKFSLTEE